MDTKRVAELAKALCDTIMEDFGAVLSEKWQYDAGLVLKGFEAMYEKFGDKKYYDYAKAGMDYFINDDGTITTKNPKFRDYNPEERNIDNLNNGKNVMYLWKKTGEEKYKKAIELLASQFAIQPRTPDGTYWHKNIYPNQVWLDGLFMGEPFAAMYAKEFDHPDKFDDIVNQFVTAEAATYEPRCGLYAHACDVSKSIFWADKLTGRSLNVWGRSVGWMCMALEDALDYFPEDHSGRQTLIDMLQKVMSNVVRYQDSTGVWYQVLDNRRDDNYPESTCTCMFAYALKKGILKGYLDADKYTLYLERAVDAIINRFIDIRDGKVYITNGCAVAGLGPEKDHRRNGTLDYYMSEPIRDNDFKGVGPFLIMAAM